MKHSSRSLRAALAWLPALVLAPVVGAQLVFFAMHAANVLAYPYPLDYGEGPLLAQVQQLLRGTSIWGLYADPGASPYLVVNYPPAYHLATLPLAAILSPLLGEAWGPLLAGRLVSLLGTLAAAGAVFMLVGWGVRSQESGVRSQEGALRMLAALAFLGIPIVREWSVVMRVDALGVGLGLWGLVLARGSAAGRRRVIWPALLIGLSLLVKPSLIAAPAAALVWLWFRDRGRALRLLAALAALGGAVCGLLLLGSGGWFFTHVITANANPIDQQLAGAFWDDQLEILWPLVLAGVIGGLLALYAARWRSTDREPEGSLPFGLLPVYYTLFGAFVALGVGKVGAYANYFLEFYAGLVWLAGAAVTARAGSGREERPAASAKASPGTTDAPSSFVPSLRSGQARRPSSFVARIVPILLAAALLRYYPLWSEEYLKPYGLIEGVNPARVAFGGYGVWDDLARERAVLGALGRVNAALAEEVRAAGGPIVTDLPGIAAQAEELARHQAFEHRQIYDVGLWDQRPLLRDMANGAAPLVALDYLGNWLTPEMIALITHRYAQDGSRGPYDLYRPVDPGPRTPRGILFPAGLLLEASHLAPPPAGVFGGGETAVVTLEWRRQEGGVSSQEAGGKLSVVLRLVDSAGEPVAEGERALVYGALAPEEWGGAAVQHMQPLVLPFGMAPGSYTVTAALRRGGAELGPAQPVGELAVGEGAGRPLGERGYFVPAPLLEAWGGLGGYDGPGDPLTPAVPFSGYVQQCFRRECLRLAGGEVERVPLGALVQLAETDAAAFGSGVSDGPLLAYWRDSGGIERFGDVLAPPFTRRGREVLYTRYARLELVEGQVRAAPLGDEFLRLPGGVPYRWPAP